MVVILTFRGFFFAKISEFTIWPYGRRIPTSEWGRCCLHLSKTKTEVIGTAITPCSVTKAITVAEGVQDRNRAFINAPWAAAIPSSCAVRSSNIRAVFYKALCSTSSLCARTTRQYNKTNRTDFENVKHDI